MANTPLDLGQLALDRNPKEHQSRQPSRYRRFGIRYLLPAATLIGFAALLGVSAGRHWLPRPKVSVMPVIAKRAEVVQAGTALFQAPGWIEPRPTAISVAALAPGVIESLLVVEGQAVEKGEPVARLISIDAELNVERARNTVAIREGEWKRAKAELAAAKRRLNHPLHLQVQLSDAESMLAKAETELAKLPFLAEAAKANVKYAEQNLQGKRSAEGAISGRLLSRAESDLAAEQAKLQELEQREPNLKRDVHALSNKVHALKSQLELLIEETRQVEEAEAKVDSAAALWEEAKLQLRQAKLVLERNVVKSPMSGRILRLVASPGTRVSGASSSASHSASTVVEMYDPERLQVRADVRLEDVPMVQKGQPVEIETASSSVVIQGRVLQATSAANVQKNTLEVKVELMDPPATVSPEMLVTTTFLSPEVNGGVDASAERERLFIPKSLIQTNDQGDYVWCVSAESIAERKAVSVGGTAGDDLVEIESGLDVTAKLITSRPSGLKDGDWVEIESEDQTMGVN
ncbi:HlyD family efflux transporter periplasmic adaptor subunit [Rhodopirellula halodulae]|uniref:HlyD family efflux transporter periplasmic adaptor subunit n=1 Tax=Rhodopirellula halodulae TaxID=2894198 RepID=UPI001E3DC014|nr:HlyD family efflux transporter periplasmic adaptor subunit [Rhodopirellula sp. JC737]MCC9658417.1 HlyD family efflux transporter periplasmic adaptor subunit [Rhodopirellula sp. JC737]